MFKQAFKPLFTLVLLIVSVLLVSCSPLGKLLPGPAPNYTPLKQDVVKYLGGVQGKHAVYFKDLESGQSFGINEKLPIPPASCIKVPVVLYLYQQVAAGKLQWNQRVAYHRATDYEAGAGALQYTAEEGNTFSLRCLATVAITISDNVAYNMLVRYLGADNIMKFIKPIGPNTTRAGGSALTTAKDLGAFAEAAYHFDQKNPSQGNRLISDLANSIFHIGLPGKLPSNLQVAHKEGSISGVVNDMGIVYCKRPYILAVMSLDTPDEDTGFHQIAELTRLIYDFQNKLPAASNLKP
jgi:beta-lactamase class A